MSIVDNKKAFHDYFIEERFEAGLVLEGISEREWDDFFATMGLAE